MIPIALIAGALGLVLSVFLRRDTGKPKSWNRSEGIVDDRFVYASIPGLSLLLLGIGGLGLVLPGVGGAFSPTLGAALIALCVAVAAAGAVLTGYGLFAKKLPIWIKPKWARGK